jgi:hypothetical protein
MDSDLVMPFGKHRGTRIGDLPSSYLKWLAETCDKDDICEAADAEYNWRTDHSEHWESG